MEYLNNAYNVFGANHARSSEWTDASKVNRKPTDRRHGGGMGDDSMNAGQDSTMIAIHESALSKIGGVLITLQDETIKRLSDATEAAEARAAQLEAERDDLRRQLEQAQQTCERMNEIIKKIAKEREDIKEERDNLRLSIVNNVSA